MHEQTCGICHKCPGHKITAEIDASWIDIAKEFKLPFNTQLQVEGFFQGEECERKLDVLQKYFLQNFNGTSNSTTWGVSVMRLLCTNEYLRKYYFGNSG